MKYSKQNDTFAFVKDGTLEDQLPKGVYEIQTSKELGVYLEKVSDSFKIPKKTYGDENKELIRNCKNAWNKLNKNISILLCGSPGTGKTVLGKKICEELQLPVLLFSSNNYSLLDIVLQKIDQPVIVFFDEFDKFIVSEEVESSELAILNSLLDGAKNNFHPRFFIFTMNSRKDLPETFYNRPSRIRYSVTTENLKENTIKEIVNDFLADHPDLIEKALSIIDDTSKPTIDTIFSICEELVINNEVSFVFNISRVKEYNAQLCTRDKKISFIIGKILVKDLDTQNEVLTIVTPFQETVSMEYQTQYRYHQTLDAKEIGFSFRDAYQFEEFLNKIYSSSKISDIKKEFLDKLRKEAGIDEETDTVIKENDLYDYLDLVLTSKKNKI